MTTAISLSLTVLAGTLAYVLWAAHEVAGGTSALWFVAGVPVAALAIPALLTTSWFVLSWVWRAPRPAAIRLTPAGLVRVWYREVLAVALSVPRMILYRVLLPDPAPAPATTPVLLLHGVLCNAGVWVPLARQLAARGIGPVYALSYGPPLASIDLFADQAAAKIEAIVAATGARDVVLVCHSMGGLVARACVRRHGAARIRRIVTLGSPHHGSVLAYIFPGTSLSQLRPDSAWLAALNAAPPPSVPPIVSLWSWHDSMVAPQTSSVLDGARNVALSGVAHNALLADQDVMRRVVAEIEAAAAPRG